MGDRHFEPIELFAIDRDEAAPLVSLKQADTETPTSTSLYTTASSAHDHKGWIIVSFVCKDLVVVNRVNYQLIIVHVEVKQTRMKRLRLFTPQSHH